MMQANFRIQDPVTMKVTKQVMDFTLWLHYNAILYNVDSIITRSPRCSQNRPLYNGVPV